MRFRGYVGRLEPGRASVACHNGGKLKFDETLQSFRPDRHADPIHAIGAANGTFALGDILREAYDIGSTAAESALPGSKAMRLAPPSVKQPDSKPMAPIWFSPATGKYNGRATSTSSISRTT